MKPVEINAAVIGGFSEMADAVQILEHSQRCGHSSHLLIREKQTIWLYRQTVRPGVRLTIDAEGNVVEDDSMCAGGRRTPFNRGRLIRRVFANRG